jgi:long-chain fatty acid transport protein
MNPRRQLFLTLLFAAASAEAQLTVIPRFDFSFSNPGARSLGFGGAFAALADDATAAYANPAGLVQLTETEVSFETRLWNRSPSFIVGGRIDGEPTGRGLDTRRGLVFERDHSQDVGPSFASVVIPRGRWSFAFYGHQLAQFEQSAESQGFFTEEDVFFPFGLFRTLASRETVDLEVVTAGTAAGFRLNDRLSIGLGIVVSDVSLNAKAGSYFPGDGDDQYGEASFRPEDQFSSLAFAMEGTAVTVNAGVLGRVSEQLSASLFYRQGAEVDGSATAILFPGFPDSELFRYEVAFKVPDVAGAGLAFRSKDGRVTLAAETDWIEYSDVFQVGEAGVEYQDGWEYHVGAEYALLQSTPILAFRAGAWVEKREETEAFLDDRDVTHLSAGLGIVTSFVQIDLAGDFSDRGDTASLSFIYDF